MDSLLAVLRRAGGANQQDFAAKCGIPRSTWAMVESGERPVSADLATKAAAALSELSGERVTAAEVVAAAIGDAGTAARRRQLRAALRTVADTLSDPTATVAAKREASELGHELVALAEDLGTGNVDATDEADEAAVAKSAGDGDVGYYRDALGRARTASDHTRDNVGRSRKSIDDDDRHRRDAHGRRR
jgi:transcriptional regulator with XRE-family HTH domain